VIPDPQPRDTRCHVSTVRIARESTSAAEETREKLRRIAERSKKNEAISIRMSSFDLQRIKSIAAEQGMPYQTLINVIVHKYVTNRKETGAI
jgi:predicted DNA binding CopG/RHH family protein